MTQPALDGMPAVPGSDSATGVVGNRQLIAVQTFDIARLTTDPVPIVPGAFDVVSGLGPKGDSNETGKTTFLAAVSLLLAEAQWRLETDHGQRARGLLFRPAAAGVPEARYRPADHGFIVGVFADPANPADDQLTVWMRLSVSAPYVLVRHAKGLHVARGDSDEERYEQDDALWDGLDKATQMGTRKLAEGLYGTAPRCIAYLDTSLRPAAPSLLSQQIAEMTPAKIGEALIALTGRESMLDSEVEQRRVFSEQHIELQDKVEADKNARSQESDELAAVLERDMSRRALRDGEHLWRLHFARGYLDAVAEDATAAEAVQGAQGALARAKDELDNAATELRTLRENTDVEGAERAARAEVDRLEGRQRQQARTSNIAAADIDALGKKRSRLREVARGWDGRTVASAQETDLRAQGELTEATLTLREAERDHDRAVVALAQARGGTGGPAGLAMGALTGEGVSALPLLDHIQVRDGARDRWEPRLWAHRGAVVVAPGDEQAALAALASVPGSVVVVADGPLDGPDVELEGALASAPVGRFLAALLARTEHLDEPARAADPALGEATIGGFLMPIAGRAARVAAAESAATASERVRVGAKKAKEAVRLRAQDSAAQLEGAIAATELEALKMEEARLRGLQQEADAACAALQELLDPAKGAHVLAAAIALNHAGLIKVAAQTWQLRKTQHSTAQGELRELQDGRARARLTYWQDGWGGNADEAQVLLDAQPDTIATGKKASLRNRAADALKEALDTFLRGFPQGDVPADLAEARRRRQQLADGEGGVARDSVDFASVALPLRNHLDGMSERDELQSGRILHEQARRSLELSALNAEVGLLESDLAIVQDMVAASIEGALLAISRRLDTLNRGRGGFGAELRYAHTRPDSPAAAWLWEVTPYWRRSPAASMTSYKVTANGAQIKVFAIQLVLAALLASEGASGRVLVLDELGNSLGDENRKDVLADLAAVAREQNVTILGACQDSVLADAATACGQILWFDRPAQTDVYNKATRTWGFDAGGERVEAVAEWLREGRTLA